MGNLRLYTNETGAWTRNCISKAIKASIQSKQRRSYTISASLPPERSEDENVLWERRYLSGGPLAVDLARPRAPREKQRALGAIRGGKLKPRRVPGPSKIIVSLKDDHSFSEHLLFNSNLEKKLPNAFREPLRDLGELPGALGRMKNEPKSGPGAPRWGPMNVLSASRPPHPRAATKSDLKRSWRSRWAQRRPGGLQALIWCPPGPFDPRFSFVPCHVILRFRLRARVRSLFFEGFEALILKVGSPRSLKPWVAAGGREAIRIRRPPLAVRACLKHLELSCLA